MKNLKLEIPDYSKSMDPTKTGEDITLDWTITKSYIENIKKLYNLYCKNYKKRKLELKEKEGTVKKKVDLKNETVKQEDNRDRKCDTKIKQEPVLNGDDSAVVV